MLNSKKIANALNVPEKDARILIASMIGRVPMLLLGPPQTGKTRLVKKLCAGFGAKMARAQGHEEVSPLDFCGYMDLPKAINSGEDTTIWNKEWLKAEVNFVDEINRIPMGGQNGLLTQMAEGVAIRTIGQEAKKNPSWFVFTANYEDDSTFGIMPPLAARIGASIVMDNISLKQLMNQDEDIPNESFGDLNDLMDTFSGIEISMELKLRINAMVRMTSACKYGKKSEINQDICASEDCHFRNLPCSFVKGPGLGVRTAMSISSLMKGLATIDGASSPTYDHFKESILAVLPFSLRGKFSENFFTFLNTSNDYNRERKVFLAAEVAEELAKDLFHQMDKNYSENFQEMCKEYAMNSRGEKNNMHTVAMTKKEMPIIQPAALEMLSMILHTEQKTNTEHSLTLVMASKDLSARAALMAIDGFPYSEAIATKLEGEYTINKKDTFNISFSGKKITIRSSSSNALDKIKNSIRSQSWKAHDGENLVQIKDP